MNHPEVIQGLHPCSRCGKTYCGDCLVELKGARFCARCKSEEVKDIQSGIDSAELPLAGVGRRFVAMIVDSICLWAVTIPLAFAFGFFAATAGPVGPEPAMGLQLGVQALIMGIFFLYDGLMIQMRGQTLGKMVLKIKVVSPDGSAIAPGQAWIRAIIRLIVGGCLIDYIPALFRKDKCTIHDMAARTRVIRLTD
jgi:uncharacterized RDD family membrane protein YckC